MRAIGLLIVLAAVIFGAVYTFFWVRQALAQGRIKRQKVIVAIYVGIVVVIIGAAIYSQLPH